MISPSNALRLTTPRSPPSQSSLTMQRYTHVTPELTQEASEKLNEFLKPLLN
jgi:hypothetical protein